MNVVMRLHSQSIVRTLRRILWVGGSLTLASGLFIWAKGEYAQYTGEAELRELASAGTTPAKWPFDQGEGSLVGRIRIPTLGLSAIVFEGTSNSTLGKGVGHLRGSALPGGSGNIVLAGHRDTVFRELEQLHVNQEIVVETPRSSGNYRVQSIRIVDPSAVELLRPTRAHQLTLITCYPFNYFGNAPKRWIVQAVPVS